MTLAFQGGHAGILAGILADATGIPEAQNPRGAPRTKDLAVKAFLPVFFFVEKD
jgi:hypothetical protein